MADQRVNQIQDSFQRGYETARAEFQNASQDPDKSVRESMLTYYSEHPDLDTDGVFSLVYTLPQAKLRSVILEFYGAFTTSVADEGEREIAYGILRRYQRNAGLTKLAGLN